MSVDPMSTRSYHETTESRLSQRVRLMAFMLENRTEGVTDREIGEHLGISNALASARRNGLKKELAEEMGDWQLVSIGKTRDTVTGRLVNFWGLVPSIQPGTQRELFR
jgi:hypothetical protein